MNSSKISIIPERTPNPNTMMFKINRILLDEPIEFNNAKEAERSPLASKLFGFPWASGIFIGRDYISITKQDWVEWELLAEPLAGLLKEHFDSDLPLLYDFEEIDNSVGYFDENDSPEVRLIKQVLFEEIRPALAMDGGDISFHKYENNKVYVYMRGACSGCPSATITLKQGIETRLKEALPEIEEVISL